MGRRDNPFGVFVPEVFKPVLRMPGKAACRTGRSPDLADNQAGGWLGLVTHRRPAGAEPPRGGADRRAYSRRSARARPGPAAAMSARPPRSRSLSTNTPSGSLAASATLAPPPPDFWRGRGLPAILGNSGSPATPGRGRRPAPPTPAPPSPPPPAPSPSDSKAPPSRARGDSEVTFTSAMTPAMVTSLPCQGR